MQIRQIPVLLFVCLMGIPVMSRAKVVLNGSDLLAGPVGEAIEKAISVQGIEVECDLGGSLTGRDALESGRADACLLAIPDSMDVPESYRQYPVAFQAAIFMVSESNPLVKLSYNKLAHLFGNGDRIENWSELISSITWADRKIGLLASRQDKLLTLELFNEEVLGGAPFSDALEISEKPSEALKETIRLDPNLLMLVPYMELDKGVRFVDIQATKSDQSYDPSPSNIYFGDYPLRLPFYLVVSESLKPDEVKGLLQAILSPSVTDVLRDNHFVPLPDQEKRELLSRFD